MTEQDADAEMAAILRETFGDSQSDSDAEESESSRNRRPLHDSTHSIFGDTHIWEPIPEISGLWISRDFLSADQQSALLSALEKDGYLAEDSHNQAMKFGDLPDWAMELSYYIREDVAITSDNSKAACVFPSDLLWREPLFNQFIVNIYKPGEGICAHVDLMRFEDGIAIVSLESSCLMHFSPVEDENAEKNSAKIPVLLNPGSIVLMWGEARYRWKHEINRKPGFQKWDGEEIEQKRRVSVTLRKLCCV
ncbi:uncharacterized protein LOC127242958 [Andrographis paniculata]|uniref:uncharacterized protein LOC127242958 n=1 Tax=Andrographis paniculata TaxID=175694 RepID=UPI0021E6ED2C|nr:uncharacterized protein LOC127242958 [Andrographis paniculata]